MQQKVDNLSRKEFLAALKRSGKRRGKYNAKRVTIDGRTYDSKREAEVACEYALKLRAGQISAIEYQPSFELTPKPNKISYVADFRITYPDGTQKIVDVKGMETPVFKLKAKLFKHFYPDLHLTILK